MGEVKQESSPKSKSQHLQQTSKQQTEPLSEQSILSRQSNPIGQTISRISSTPSLKAHADILNRAPDQSRHVLLQLQRQYGNRYVQQVVQQARQTERSKIQAKLTLGAVSDKYELEADRVAKQVVSNISSASQQPVQRMKPEEEQAQMKPDIQRMARGEAATVDSSIEDGIQQARGSGVPLADNIREPMEQAFGADFSGVKVHTDAQADQLNQSIQAKAFTTGQDVFFRQGEYNPGSRGGQELIAHELTHVVQQSGGAVRRSALPLQALPQHAATDTILASASNRAIQTETKSSLKGNAAKHQGSIPQMCDKRPLLSLPQLLSTENRIQRVIGQNFLQSQKEANQENLKNFFDLKVKNDLEAAKKIVNEDLKLMAPTLKDYEKAYETRYKSAVDRNYPNNWNLAVTALDYLVSYTNKIIMESTRPEEYIYDENTDTSQHYTRIPGEMTKEGIPDQWGYAKEDVLNPTEYISFYHATTAKGKIENNQIKIMGGAKEFGEGFYTTATDIDTPAKKIGEEWFTKKQQNPDWVIIRFDIPKSYTSYLESKNPNLNKFLYYILSHTTGYPSGGVTANEQDMTNINAINLEGRVLIFPDKTTKVQTREGEKSWDDYTKNKLGGGSYKLVIGPQQPTYMGTWRQYAFTAGRGLWLINTAKRFIAYENKGNAAVAN